MIDPELVPFLEAWFGKWSQVRPGATPQERRAYLEALSAEFRLDPVPDVDPSRQYMVATDFGDVRVRVFRWRSDEPQACLVYMHGGGWVQGSPETHWDVAAGIAGSNRQTVLSIDYALAPENPFPAAINQCRAVVEWAFDNAAEVNIDPTRIAIGGDSAGGNLAAAVALALRDTRRRLKGQLLIYPVTDFALDRPSMKENGNGPGLLITSLIGMYDAYCPSTDDRRNPLAAPLLTADHAGLPPAFVAVGEYDPLRDCGLAYAEALAAAGVPVTLDRGEGMTHGYLRAMAYSKSARERFGAMCRWLEGINGLPQ